MGSGPSKNRVESENHRLNGNSERRGLLARNGWAKYTPPGRKRKSSGRKARPPSPSPSHLRRSRSETKLDEDINEIVATVDAAESQELRGNHRGMDSLGQSSRSAPEAVRLAPVMEGNENAAPKTAPDIRPSDKAALPRRPCTRHGRQPEAVPKPPPPPATDEWEYKQIAIEGFDPEKFKKVNNNRKNTGHRRENYSDFSLGGICEEDLPGTMPSNQDSFLYRTKRPERRRLAVAPAYDINDEKLMASIEQEFTI